MAYSKNLSKPKRDERVKVFTNIFSLTPSPIGSILLDVSPPAVIVFAQVCYSNAE